MGFRIIKTEIPEGYEIDNEKSTFERIVLKTVGSNDWKSELPNTFEDLFIVSGYFISSHSSTSESAIVEATRDTKNVWPTKHEAEAALALSQLFQLRDRFNELDPEPEPSNVHDYCKLVWGRTGLSVYGYCSNLDEKEKRGLYFKSKKAANLFAELYKDLLEQARPLL